MKPIVDIFSDGACKGNPGIGGWGVLLRSNGSEKTLKGCVLETTNNRMELQAAIEGLKALKTSCHVTVHTDSQYVRRGMIEWLPNWKKNAWKTSAKKPVKNGELWKELDNLASLHQVTWKWVKGHSGHPENDRADELANEAIIEYLGQETKNDTTNCS